MVLVTTLAFVVFLLLAVPVAFTVGMAAMPTVKETGTARSRKMMKARPVTRTIGQ